MAQRHNGVKAKEKRHATNVRKANKKQVSLLSH
jgi:hypothetical protein